MSKCVFPAWTPDKHLTYGEVLGPAMLVQSDEEAVLFLDEYCKYLHHFNPDKTWDDLLVIAKNNLGYYAGYYDQETMNRVNKWFNTSHPIFGRDIPSAEAAFEAGKTLGKTGSVEKAKETVEAVDYDRGDKLATLLVQFVRYIGYAYGGSIDGVEPTEVALAFYNDQMDQMNEFVKKYMK